MIFEHMDSGRIRIVGIVLCMAAGLFCLLGSNWKAQDITFQRALSEQAARRIDESLEKNLVVFAAVSSIKAAVALVEGSTIGVGFQLEVGDLVQPAYDYIDFVWRLFLYSLLILTFYKQLMQSGILGLGVPVMGIGLLLWGLGFLWFPYKRSLHEWARRLFLAGFLVAYFVPALLVASHGLSTRYTEPLKEETHRKFASVRQEFTQASDEILALKEKVSILRPGESLEEIRLTLLQSTEKVSNAAWKSVGVLLYYVSILLFEYLILPFVMALLMYLFFQALVGKIQGLPGLRPGISPLKTGAAG